MMMARFDWSHGTSRASSPGMSLVVLATLMPACFGIALLLQFATLKLILKALAAHARAEVEQWNAM